MKIAFISNYYNHHQQMLSECLYRETNGEYRFIETGVMRQERKNLGYEIRKKPDFILHTYLEKEELQMAEEWIGNADVVIVGSAPEELIKRRVKSGKLIFRYSERPLKNGLELHKYCYRYLKWHKHNPRKSEIYLLCASAYTAADYAKFGLFKNRCYQWGYFPKLVEYNNINELICNKRDNSILWVGRFLEWKHPDDALLVAHKLKEAGYHFQLNFIGSGEMEMQLKEMIVQKGLEDCVQILGSMKPDLVRSYMEQSQIFLFTSDRKEGWGAVLNEAMNSGCAVVASHECGSVPFLLEDGKNGMIYESHNTEMLYEKVKYLLDHMKITSYLGQNAYRTILLEWNADIAAKRLMILSKKILEGVKTPDLYSNAVCHKAKKINDRWHKEIRNI